MKIIEKKKHKCEKFIITVGSPINSIKHIYNIAKKIGGKHAHSLTQAQKFYNSTLKIDRFENGIGAKRKTSIDHFNYLSKFMNFY